MNLDNIQIHQPEPLLLASFSSLAGVSQTVEFMAPCPDPRLRVRTSFIWMNQGALPRAAAPAWAGVTLHLGTYERSRYLRVPEVFPLVNLVGTPSAGIPFPSASNNFGTSYTWDGPGEFIYGKMAFDQATIAPVYAMNRFLLQCTYTPMVRLCPDEWAYVKANANPYMIADYIATTVSSA